MRDSLRQAQGCVKHGLKLYPKEAENKIVCRIVSRRSESLLQVRSLPKMRKSGSLYSTQRCLLCAPKSLHTESVCFGMVCPVTWRILPLKISIFAHIANRASLEIYSFDMWIKKTEREMGLARRSKIKSPNRTNQSKQGKKSGPNTASSTFRMRANNDCVIVHVVPKVSA